MPNPPSYIAMSADEYRAALLELGITNAGFRHIIFALTGVQPGRWRTERWASGKRTVPLEVEAFLALLRKIDKGHVREMAKPMPRMARSTIAARRRFRRIANPVKAAEEAKRHPEWLRRTQAED